MDRKFVVVAAALAAGCGSSTERQTAAGFCDALVSAWSAKQAQCTPVTPAAARSLLALGVPCAPIAAAVEEGRATFSPPRAEACLAAMEAQGCWAFGQQQVPDPCGQVLTGLVPPGGACHTDLDVECADGYCALQACDAPGTCLAYAPVGGDCSTGARCAEGASCDGATCVADPAPVLLSIGQACSQGGTCGDGLYCDWYSGVDPVVCKTRRPAGTACGSDEECAYGLWCTPAGTCAPWSQVGGACAPGAGECPYGLFCQGAGTCASFPGVGGACGALPSGEYADCLGSWCDLAPGAAQGTCAAYLGAGASCDPAGAWNACGPALLCDQATATCAASSCTDG